MIATPMTAREEALAASRAELLKAAIALQEDLLMRAELDDDGTKVVNASHGRWINFCDAIARAQGEPS